MTVNGFSSRSKFKNLGSIKDIVDILAYIRTDELSILQFLRHYFL